LGSDTEDAAAVAAVEHRLQKHMMCTAAAVAAAVAAAGGAAGASHSQELNCLPT
jgi:hypothetical protein